MRCPTLAELPPPPAGKTGWPWTSESPPVAQTPPSGAPWPTISIVTPSYNQGHFIEETIRSVLLQGYPNLEYIVMDGGSKDQTPEILRKYDRWISHWQSEPDNGQVAALNAGFRHTSGELLNWLNSDDFLWPGALAAIANFWNLDKSIDLISGARIFRSDGIEQIYAPWLRTWPMLCLGIPDFAQETTFYSRRLWNRIGSLDERLNYGFDVAFLTAAVTAADKIALTTVPFATMNVHARQKTRLADPEKSREVEILKNEYSSRTYGHALLWRLLTSRFHFIVQGLLQIFQYRRAQQKLYYAYYDHFLSAWTIKPFS